MASQNPTNLFGLYQIPEPDQLMFPINLVLFQWRLTFSIRNLKLHYLILDLKNLTQKSGLVRTQRTNWSWLIRLKMKTRPRTDPPNFWRCDLKKRKNVTHPIVIVFDQHFLYWLGNLITFFKYFLMWSQINVPLSIRRTGSQQIDFKVSSHF